jgi:hypothetical protein
MTLNPQRQPRGTATGGQFASSLNPEPTVDLNYGRVANASLPNAIESLRIYYQSNDSSDLDEGMHDSLNDVFRAYDASVVRAREESEELESAAREADQTTDIAEPNNPAADLLSGSWFTMRDEWESDWRGEVCVDGVILQVRNYGDGTPNDYDYDSSEHGWAEVENAASYVGRGFPELAGKSDNEALDAFVSILREKEQS